jgi:hypothetical protein
MLATKFRFIGSDFSEVVLLSWSLRIEFKVTYYATFLCFVSNQKLGLEKIARFCSFKIWLHALYDSSNVELLRIRLMRNSWRMYNLDARKLTRQAMAPTKPPSESTQALASAPRLGLLRLVFLVSGSNMWTLCIY